jgi:acyl carrier protein
MSANSQKITTWIENALTPVHAGQEITPATALVSSQLLDSLQIMDLVFFLEEEFGNPVPLEELTAKNFETVTSIAALVVRVSTAPQQRI